MGRGDVYVGHVQANPLVRVILNVEDDFVDDVNEIFKSWSDFRVFIPASQHHTIPVEQNTQCLLGRNIIRIVMDRCT